MMRSEKRVTYKDEAMTSTSSSDAKIDSLVRKNGENDGEDQFE